MIQTSPLDYTSVRAAQAEVLRGARPGLHGHQPAKAVRRTLTRSGTNGRCAPVPPLHCCGQARQVREGRRRDAIAVLTVFYRPAPPHSFTLSFLPYPRSGSTTVTSETVVTKRPPAPASAAASRSVAGGGASQPSRRRRSSHASVTSTRESKRCVHSHASPSATPWRWYLPPAAGACVVIILSPLSFTPSPNVLTHRHPSLPTLPRLRFVPLIDVWSPSSLAAWLDVRKITIKLHKRIQTRTLLYVSTCVMLGAGVMAWQARGNDTHRNARPRAPYDAPACARATGWEGRRCYLPAYHALSAALTFVPSSKLQYPYFFNFPLFLQFYELLHTGVPTWAYFEAIYLCEHAPLRRPCTHHAG